MTWGFTPTLTELALLFFSDQISQTYDMDGTQ